VSAIPDPSGAAPGESLAEVLGDPATVSSASDVDRADDADWWRGAVIYQIYPRSFQDSNGDGVGDLPGIAERLEHVAELGADAIWVSPFYPSPMKDFGYDVSDYRDVDPMFGDLAAFDHMVSRAHALGLRVMIDLVLSHTADTHEWFVESSAGRDNPRSDWYVWADAKPDGGPPNNWLSIFGGPGWTWHTGRCQYYLHNFLVSQPDLNFHSMAVQEALLDVARFWLDRGVDGFRLDTVNFYVHDATLADNPPLPPDLRDTDLAPEVNPYGYQDHVHDKNRPENLDFLARLRSVMDEYPGVAAVGEIGEAPRHAMQLLADYTSGTERLHMAYTFDFLTGARPDAARFSDVLRRFEEQAGDAWACWAFSNHDVIRHASRWATDDEHRERHLKTLASLLLSLRGSVCLYQGEELGLTEADIAFEDLQDPYGIAFWPEFRGRDGCRTPMVWEAQGTNAGFGRGMPWLPVPDEHRELAVDAQAGEPESLLEHYRAFLRFRRRHPALAKGGIEAIAAHGDVLTFRRTAAEVTLLCAFNLSDQPARHEIGEMFSPHLLDGRITDVRLADGVLEMAPYSAAFVRLDAAHDGPHPTHTADHVLPDSPANAS